MTENLGSGVRLDKDFDISIDRTGDVETVSGLNELEKDLSMQMAFSLNQFVGAPPSDDTRSSAKRVVAQVLNADERIQRIVTGSITVEWSGPKRRQIDVGATVVASEQEQELVFRV